MVPLLEDMRPETSPRRVLFMPRAFSAETHTRAVCSFAPAMCWPSLISFLQPAIHFYQIKLNSMALLDLWGPWSPKIIYSKVQADWLSVEARCAHHFDSDWKPGRPQMWMWLFRYKSVEVTARLKKYGAIRLANCLKQTTSLLPEGVHPAKVLIFWVFATNVSE